MVITHSDPKRQWFLYFKEKEIGPLSEAELIQKLDSGEINATAYVYTEGMPDWALISETPVLAPGADFESDESSARPTISQGAQAEATPTENIEMVPAPTDLESLSPTEAAPLVTEKFEAPGVAAKVAPAASPKKRSKLALLIPAALGIAVLAFYAEKFMPLNTPKEKVAPVASTSPTTEAPKTESFSWEELNRQRESQDRNGAPFRLASQHLGGKRPVLLGALSPLVKAESLQVAIFSDNEKSLYAVPRLWMLKVPVIDGYFSVGPLSADSKELRAGSYHVMIAHQGNFLGEVGFEVGPWPASAELAELTNGIEQERAGLAQKEKTALDLKIIESAAAVVELQNLSKIAANGARTLPQWTKASMAWEQKMTQALNDQKTVLSGPMFYFDTQNKLYALLGELNRAWSELDAQAKTGKKPNPTLLTALNQKQLQLATETQELARSGALVTPLKMDANIVKRSLLSLE